MIEYTSELIEWMSLFRKTFNDIVPLMQISGATTNEQLIDAIKRSIESEQNLLPSIFGYDNSSHKTY